MMRRNSYLGLREVDQNLMMTEAYGAINCPMYNDGGLCSMMKVSGANTSNSSKSVM